MIPAPQPRCFSTAPANSGRAIRQHGAHPAVGGELDSWPGTSALICCPLTSTLMEAPLGRIPVVPSPRNGLSKPSQLMVDKLFTLPIKGVGAVVGQLEPQSLIELDLALRGWLELP